MPFQVNFSVRPKFITQATLISAGEDQTHICTPVIMLSAEVDGDLTGHTIIWEQISGTPVSLQQANTLTPYFNEVDNVDKVFRIYIDKNTPNVQYDDIKIYKTPRSVISQFDYLPQNSKIDRIISPDPINCNDFLAYVKIIVPPPTSLEGEESGYTITGTLEWQHPGDPIKDFYIEQYRVIENSINNVAQIPVIPIPNAGDGGGPPTDTLAYDGIISTYRIDTYYNIAGQHYIAESCTKDLTIATIPNVKAYNDTTHQIITNPNTPKLNKISYGFILLNNNESLVDTIGTSPNKPIISIIRYTHSHIGENFSSTPTVAQYKSTVAINIIRYDPSGIGGG